MKEPKHPAITRYNRLAKQKQRGSLKSYVTELEDLKICLAWEAAELTEGQAARALGYDRVTLRNIRYEAIRAGRDLYEQLKMQ